MIGKIKSVVYHSGRLPGLFEITQIVVIIVVSIKTGIAVIAVLDNMRGNTGQVKPGFTRHNPPPYGFSDDNVSSGC